jgi:hypothetical protein
MGLLLNKDEILAVNDLDTEDVSVPEWGGIVRLRVMTGTDLDGWEVASFNAQKKGGDLHVRAGLVARCAVDKQGKRLFTNKEAVELGKKSGKALNRLYEKALKMNGISEEESKEIEKNSETAHEGNSTSR